MSGTDIFVAVLFAVMLFGGLFLNITSRRLADQYAASHRAEPIISKSSAPGSRKVQRK